MNPVTLTALEIVRPGDARYDEVRPAWNLTVDQRPAAIAVPRDAEQVVAAVLYAKREGLRVAAQGTGHNASPLGDLSNTLLIKTHEMRGVEIDAENRIPRAEAGAQWGEVVDMFRKLASENGEKASSARVARTQGKQAVRALRRS